MDRIRAAAASVALVSTNNALIDQLTGIVADEATTVVAYTLLAALIAVLGNTAPDLVVIDAPATNAPSDDIRRIRRILPAVQIVFVNVKDERGVISLLKLGADDAVRSGSRALGARLQASTRRARTLNAQNRIAVGDIVFDRESRRVWCSGKEVELTPHEFSVVDCLFWHTPKPVDFATLAHFVWGGNEADDMRALIQTYVSYVRRKLAPSKRVTIRHVRDVGYSFAPK